MTERLIPWLALVLLGCALPTPSRSDQSGQRIAYGTADSLQFGELRMPQGPGPFPLAIVIHGGCWLSHFGLDGTSAFASALTADGIASWNVEYRRVGNSGGGWPGTFQDVAAATDFARTLAKSHPIDLSRVVVVGHSAGAQLALWTAARPKLARDSELHAQSPLPLLGVMALGGPGDLRSIGAKADRVCGAGTIGKLLGGTPTEVPRHYADASAAALLPLGVFQVLVAGSQDGIMPPGLLESYAEAAKAAGDQVDLQIVAGANHMDLIGPESPAWPVVHQKLRELLSHRH